MNTGEELFFSQTRLSTAGRPQLCSFIVMVTDSSTTRGSNMSLFSGVNQHNHPFLIDVTQTLVKLMIVCDKLLPVQLIKTFKLNQKTFLASKYTRALYK